MERINAVTGLYTQELFETLFEYEIARTRRYPAPLSLLRLALQLPDTSRSDMVESVRLMLAQQLHLNLRDTDLSAHYGTDFLVLLPNTDLTGAKIVAQRLIELFAYSAVTRNGDYFQPSICIGIACHPGGRDISGDWLLDAALHALDMACSRGKNNFFCAEEMSKHETA